VIAMKKWNIVKLVLGVVAIAWILFHSFWIIGWEVFGLHKTIQVALQTNIQNNIALFFWIIVAIVCFTPSDVWKLFSKTVDVSNMSHVTRKKLAGAGVVLLICAMFLALIMFPVIEYRAYQEEAGVNIPNTGIISSGTYQIEVFEKDKSNHVLMLDWGVFTGASTKHHEAYIYSLDAEGGIPVRITWNHNADWFLTMKIFIEINNGWYDWRNGTTKVIDTSTLGWLHIDFQLSVSATAPQGYFAYNITMTTW